MSNPTDKEILLKAQPYLRSLLAFILYVRWSGDRFLLQDRSIPGPAEMDSCYKVANQFLDRLYKDVTVSSKIGQNRGSDDIQSGA